MTKPDERRILKKIIVESGYTDLIEESNCQGLADAIFYEGFKRDTRQSPVMLPEKKYKTREQLDDRSMYTEGFNEAIDLISKMNEGARQPQMKLNLEQATKLALETEYALEAVTHGINPINEADAGAFFLEGFEYARQPSSLANEKLLHENESLFNEIVELKKDKKDLMANLDGQPRSLGVERVKKIMRGIIQGESILVKGKTDSIDFKVLTIKDIATAIVTEIKGGI
jgi:hypothetical protein